jgi:DNA-binding NtrC family response regulator
VLNQPQLQQRSGDVEFLAREFIRRYGQQYKRRIELNADAFTALARHPWPGNIRELMHFIERLTVTAGSRDVDAEIVSRLLENREYENLGAAGNSGPADANDRGCRDRFRAGVQSLQHQENGFGPRHVEAHPVPEAASIPDPDQENLLNSADKGVPA